MSELHHKIFDFEKPSYSVNGKGVDEIISGAQPYVRASSAPKYKSNSALNNEIHDNIDEIIFDERAKLKIATAKKALAYLDKKFKDALFAQIDLVLNEEDWEVSDPVVDVKSFETLLKFVLNHRPAEAPSINISNSGNIIATWINDNSKVRMECFPSEHINFFSVSFLEGEKDIMIFESITISRLIEKIKSNRELNWI